MVQEYIDMSKLTKLHMLTTQSLLFIYYMPIKKEKFKKDNSSENKHPFTQIKT
jgi:ubiquinone biosynthesis protein Coq4